MEEMAIHCFKPSLKAGPHSAGEVWKEGKVGTAFRY
jgi:hypothetical protein